MVLFSCPKTVKQVVVAKNATAAFLITERMDPYEY
jgi:hypothetical protein